jgi:hypothetical protein
VPVNLPANNRDGLLIDRSRIPCLDSSEIGFAGLVSRARLPAMGLRKFAVEDSAPAAVSYSRIVLGKNWVWPISPCMEPRAVGFPFRSNLPATASSGESLFADDALGPRQVLLRFLERRVLTHLDQGLVPGAASTPQDDTSATCAEYLFTK